jgi:hypothetical protein
MSKITLVVILLLSAGSAFSQRTALTRAKFSEAYASAQEKAREFSRVHDSQVIDFSDGVPVFTMTWKWEYENRLRSRLAYELKGNEGTIRLEMVKLADKKFCKVNNGNWSEVSGLCPVSAPWEMTQRERMMYGNAPSEFYVEQVELDGQKLQKYCEFGKIERFTLPNGVEVQPSSYESVFFVDSKGRVMKQEQKETKSGREIETWNDRFTYLPSVKITAPI